MNWESLENEILISPYLENSVQEMYREMAQQAIELSSTKGHVWLTTSGTTNLNSGLSDTFSSSGTFGLSGTLVALSKMAFLNSAVAVGEHLKVESKDVWGLALPGFHVGGLSIQARSWVSQIPYQVFDRKWQAESFCDFLNHHHVTLTSLVPTQVYDLVARQIPCPANVRAVVVGGAALSEKLYLQARRLGWPLLPSYGMTETASQVATASLESLKALEFPKLKILSHAEFKVHTEDESSASGFFQIKSSSLFSFYVFKTQDEIKLQDPKVSGWFETADLGECFQSPSGNGFIKVKGRKSDFVKIKGEGVHFGTLEKYFNELLVNEFPQYFGRCFLKLIVNERNGFEIQLLSEGQDQSQSQGHPAVEDPNLEALLNRFNENVLPYEKISAIHKIQDSTFQRTFKTSLNF